LAEEQWRDGTVHLWNGGRLKGDVRWIPDRTAYEVRSKNVKPRIHRWIKENEIAWIALADGTIWKDYRKRKDQNKTVDTYFK